ncbi:SusD/RagB family nutrient-binding outer membrane lipoprotein [Prolixibacter sp. NT017]|uniref:SusD/RagB family nutrient-binding outer membrane lipoprotein n=1 Tax=Prolixibacter sp. NT017 TaxID=2652390 RepID=UPI0012715B1C|nr:SusD/RagB family nutrient-binding outer membrane lipoprotein [Prolixibacter sp. NT017]GET26998.1 hypothetical protein NT017_33270 [Prolixibacter sp. NT017]
MKNRAILSVIALLIAFVACTSDFKTINENPNNPETAPLTNVFAYVIESLTSEFGKTEMDYPAAFVGHITKGTYTDVINYYSKPGDGTWETIYETALTNAEYVISGAKDEGNTNLEAAAMVLKVYAMQMAVDIYGKVPFSDANLGDAGTIHPKYDDEKTVYYALLDTLERANSLFDATNGGSLGDGDLLYSGDVGQWQRFCNSLRLRLAMRISNVDETKAKSEIAAVLNAPDTYPVFSGNDDNAYISYPGGDWVEPWTSEYSSIGDNYMAKPIIDTMVNYSDPRIAYYAEPLDDGSYKGLAVGNDADTVYSKINDSFVNNPTGNVYLMVYAEVEFIKAEAVLRGFISGNAKDLYDSGITASCQEYGIGSQEISDYLANSDVSWQSSLTQIYVQKWIALFRQSWEAWAEMRRTDVPKLAPATHSTATGHNRAPFRFPYPDSEQKLNASNIPSSVTETDYFWGYQIWWDTRQSVQ